MSYKERLTILHDSEINDLYGIPALSLEEKRISFALNDLEQDVINSIRDRYHKCYAIALLGYFKINPIPLNPSFKALKEDLVFIAEEYFQKAKVPRFSVSRMQKARIYDKIFNLVNFKAWDAEQHNDSAVIHLQQVAQSWTEPRFLFDSCIEYLARNHIAIPKYTVLQRIISQVIKHERQRIANSLNSVLSDDLVTNLAELVDGNNVLTVKELKQAAKSFTAPELQKELNVNRMIQPWMPEVERAVSTLSLSQENLLHYASMVDYYSITKLKRFDRTTQQLYLLCYLRERAQINIERIADGFIYHVRKLREKAKVYAQEMAYKDWNGAAANVSKAAELLHLFIDKTIDDKVPFRQIKKRAHDLLEDREIESLCLYLNKQKRAKSDYIWEYYDQQRDLLQQLIRPLFLCLTFEGSHKTLNLAAQLKTMQTDLSKHGHLRSANHNLVPANQQLYVVDEDSKVIPERYETLLYIAAQSKLDGQLFIPAAIKYRALQDDLVGDNTWEQKHKLLKDSLLDSMNTEPVELIRIMENKMNDKLKRVCKRIDDGDNRNVILKHRSGKTQWRLPYSGAKSAVNNPFFERMTPINIADILRFVHQETSFIEHFEHVRQVQSGQSHHLNDLLAAIIGNGTYYGLHGMASISDRSYDHLRSVQANYLRPETLSLANDAINDATAKLAIFKHYNIQEGVIHASADGQKFESRLETFKTRYSSKYFGTNKGLTSMNLIANHVALNARIIGSNEHESHYIFDLLHSNTSEIKPDILSTDTHGVNHVNFALLDLFGYQFAPRYAHFSTVIADLFDINETEDDKATLSLKKPIDTKLIIEQWETIQRIVISLQRKTITQATLVRKLSGYSQNHPLLRALTEYNRMLKAMYLLDYIDDASLRGYVQRALNRGEAYHQLRRAIANVNGNRFRGKNDDEISLWNECARLLTNAIIYFNSVILTRLLEYFERKGDDKKLEIIKQVSPVAWHNINLSGTYSFSFEQNMLDMDEIMQTIVQDEN
jgi:TnpA family transposase